MNSNDWWSLFIGIAVVVGAYYYLTNATAEREAKVYQACIEMNDYDFSDAAELVAFCDELLDE